MSGADNHNASRESGRDGTWRGKMGAEDRGQFVHCCFFALRWCKVLNGD